MPESFISEDFIGKNNLAHIILKVHLLEIIYYDLCVATFRCIKLFIFLKYIFVKSI